MLHGIVPGGAGAPGVVGDVVVVPDGRHRVRRMEPLEVGIGALLGVAAPVAVERGRHLRRFVAPWTRVGLVQVVTEVYDEVDVGVRQVAVHGERTGGERGARGDAEANLTRVLSGPRGAGPADP